MKNLIESLKLEIEALDDISQEDKNLTKMQEYFNIVEALIGTVREVIKEHDDGETKIRNIRQRRNKRNAS